MTLPEKKRTIPEPTTRELEEAEARRVRLVQGTAQSSDFLTHEEYVSWLQKTLTSQRTYYEDVAIHLAKARRRREAIEIILDATGGGAIGLSLTQLGRDAPWVNWIALACVVGAVLTKALGRMSGGFEAEKAAAEASNRYRSLRTKLETSVLLPWRELTADQRTAAITAIAIELDDASQRKSVHDLPDG